MAGKLAEKRINNTGWNFCRCNGEFPQHTVGWAYLPNDENAVALQSSCGCKNLGCKPAALTPVTQEAETLVLSGFQGGGGGNP